MQSKNFAQMSKKELKDRYNQASKELAEKQWLIREANLSARLGNAENHQDYIGKIKKQCENLQTEMSKIGWFFANKMHL